MVTLAVGDYSYVCNISSSQNYSSASNSSTYTVIRANHTIHLAINGTEGDQSFSYPSLTNATGWLEILQAINTAVLYRNGSSVDTGSPATELETLGVGYYNYTYYYPASENYTEQSVTSNVGLGVCVPTDCDISRLRVLSGKKKDQKGGCQPEELSPMAKRTHGRAISC